MDSRFVGEGICAHDRLVRLHHEAGHRRDQARGAHDVLGLDAGLVAHEVVARAQRHDDLFHRGVAGTLAEPVDGALHLPRARLHGAQRVGDGEAQVVVAMDREHGLVDVWHPVEEHGDQLCELFRHGVAHGVRDVDGAGAGLDRRLHAAAEEVVLGTRAVLAGPLHIVGELAGIAHAVDHRRMHVLGLHLQLDAHVERAGRDEGVDAAGLGRGKRLGRAVDIPPPGAGQAAHGALGHHLGDLADRFEIAVGCDGETGLDHVDPHLLKDLGDPEFLLQIHRRARRLLAVAHRRIEYSDSLPCLGHNGHPFTPAATTVIALPWSVGRSHTANRSGAAKSKPA